MALLPRRFLCFVLGKSADPREQTSRVLPSTRTRTRTHPLQPPVPAGRWEIRRYHMNKRRLVQRS